MSTLTISPNLVLSPKEALDVLEKATLKDPESQAVLKELLPGLFPYHFGESHPCRFVLKPGVDRVVKFDTEHVTSINSAALSYFACIVRDHDSLKRIFQEDSRPLVCNYAFRIRGVQKLLILGVDTTDRKLVPQLRFLEGVNSRDGYVEFNYICYRPVKVEPVV